jgi:DNA mismatch endonuclease (patch repair protein)
MADTVDTVERSRIMRLVPARNTSAELCVRKLLHAAGFRFRLHRSDLPGKPDLVLPRFRMAVFVHGCFWHWHGCRRSRMPKSNAPYWSDKIARNVARDAACKDALEVCGWMHRIVWECSIASDVRELVEELRELRAKLPPPYAPGSGASSDGDP